MEEEKEIICDECKEKYKKIYKFNSYRSYEKHQWTYHPKNSIERAWSKHALEGFINWTGSSYYESYGPYY